MDADHISAFHYHYPGSFIRNWKDSIKRILTILPGVLPQPVGHFLRNEYNLLFFSAYRVLILISLHFMQKYFYRENTKS